MAAEAIVPSDDRFHAAMIAWAASNAFGKGPSLDDFLPAFRRPWMNVAAQDAAAMQAAFDSW